MTCRADPSPSDQSPLALVAQESCDKPVREKQYVACTSGAEVFGHPVPNFRNREKHFPAPLQEEHFLCLPLPPSSLVGETGMDRGTFGCVYMCSEQRVNLPQRQPPSCYMFLRVGRRHLDR